MTASTPASEPSGRRTCGMPPPPLATTTKPASIRASDGRGVEDLQRLGRGDDAAPALLAAVLPGLAVVDRAPWPRPRAGGGRSAWSGVVKPSSSASTSVRVTSGGAAPVDARARRARVEGVHQHEAERGLRLRAAPVERDGGHDARGELVLDEQVADLGAVAVGDDDLVVVLEQAGDRGHRDLRPPRSGPRGAPGRRRSSWRCRRVRAGPSCGNRSDLAHAPHRQQMSGAHELLSRCCQQPLEGQRLRSSYSASWVAAPGASSSSDCRYRPRTRA